MIRFNVLRTGLIVLFLAGAGRSADEAEVVQRDVRRDKSTEGLYIVFCVRDTPNVKFPGHAFVVWGRDDEQRQLCASEAYGYYPKGGKGVLGPVPGEV